MILELVAAIALREQAAKPPEPPKPEPIASAPAPAPPTSGTDWDAVVACEAFGDWSWTTNGNGYYFALQFVPSTWLGYGGTQAELDAADRGIAPSRERLIEVAENVLAAQGPGAWPNCYT